MSLIYTIKKNYEYIPPGVLGFLSSIYYKLPISKRYGSDFEKTLMLLRDTEFLSKERINDIVNELFKDVVSYAGKHVPYYRKKFAEYGISVNNIHDIRDIVKLPLIDKEEIRNHRDEFISDIVNRDSLMYITTSGTTGNPIGFYQKKSMMMVEWAYTMHIWSRVGCTPESSRLVLRGKKIHSNKENTHVFYDPLRKELSCDVFSMTESNMEKYCLAIEKYKPEFVHGYMSAILMLAKYISSRQGGLRHRFKGILATSENIITDQKAYVEAVFETRVFSFYGHSERLIIAGECEKSTSYHIEPLYGYCELLDKNGIQSNEGEIVATGFLNEAMPLIRYRTNDIAIWDQSEMCSCGRAHLRLQSVSGRWHQDMLVTEEGAYVSMTALNIHSDDFDKIVRYKMVQTTPGIVQMLVLPKPDFNDEDKKRIKEILEIKVNYKIYFDIKLVEDIPVLKNGKYQIVDQRI